MKVSIKTLTNQTFPLEIEPSMTVMDVKKAIEASQNHAAGSLKLIHAGKVLVDEKTIEEYSIKENEFIVMMVAKGAAKPAAASSAAAPAAAVSASSSVPATPATPAIPSSAPVSAPAAPVQAAAPPSSAVPASPVAPLDFNQAASNLVTGDSLNTSIAFLMEMGFPRDDCVRALRAAFNNPDRAVEYLMNGIPEGLAPPPQPAAAAPQAAAPQAPASAPAPAAPGGAFPLPPQGGAAAPGAGAGAAGLAAALGQMGGPQMAQLSQIIQSNPQLLGPLLQSMAAQNPQLAQLLQSNPAAVLQLLGAMGGAGGMGGAGAGGAPGAPPPGTVYVTQEESDAIDRLAALANVAQEVAAEAYFACDKNEEQAANYLFQLIESGGLEEDEDFDPSAYQ